jgi:hypothetical protein
MKDVDNYDWLQLSEDEEVFLWEHPSIVPALTGIAFGFFIMFFGIYISYNMPISSIPGWYALFLVPIGLFISTWEYIQRILVHYIITEKRVIKKTGWWFTLDYTDTDFSDVDQIDPVRGADGVSFGIVQWVFSFGDLTIKTKGNENIHFNNVPSWQEFNNQTSKLNSGNSIREVMKNHSETVSRQAQDGDTKDPLAENNK